MVNSWNPGFHPNHSLPQKHHFPYFYKKWHFPLRLRFPHFHLFHKIAIFDNFTKNCKNAQILENAKKPKNAKNGQLSWKKAKNGLFQEMVQNGQKPQNAKNGLFWGIPQKWWFLRLRGATPKEGSIWLTQMNVLLGVFSIFFMYIWKTLKNNHLCKSLNFSQFHIWFGPKSGRKWNRMGHMGVWMSKLVKNLVGSCQLRTGFVIFI